MTAEPIFVLAIFACTPSKIEPVLLSKCLLLLFLQIPVLFVNQFLLLLDVLEEVLVLRQRHVVRKDLGVLLVKLKHPRQSLVALYGQVVPLHELADVVVDEVVFEHGHHPGLLVVNDVIDDFHVVVLLAGQVLLVQVLLQNVLQRTRPNYHVLLVV